MYANALRDRALVQLALKRVRDAVSDAARSWRAYVDAGDPVGEAGSLRALAQVAEAHDRHRLKWRALDRARRLDLRHHVALSSANTDLHIASMGADRAALALAAARRAVVKYREMDLEVGVVQAASWAALRALQLGDPEAASRHADEAAVALPAARASFSDARDRADFGFTAAQAEARVLSVLHSLGDESSVRLAAEIVANAGPLAAMIMARRPLTDRFGPAVVAAAMSARAAADGPARRAALKRLASALSLVEPRAAPPDVLGEWRQQLEPNELLIVVGSPSDGRHVPVVTLAEGAEARFTLAVLSADVVDDIDHLGAVNVTSLADLIYLYDADHYRRWQRSIADTILDDGTLAWIRTSPRPRIYIAAHPSIAHIPLEALMADEQPLGVRAEIVRTPFRTKKTQWGPIHDIVGAADPSVPTEVERAALGTDLINPTDLRHHLGPGQLVWLCAHAGTGVDLDTTITAADHTCLLDAADVIGQNLSDCRVVLESCWAGRSFGQPHGEGLSLANALLLAGAAEVAAAIFPLPIAPHATGRITARVLAEARRGTSLAASLQAARAEYLQTAPRNVQLPGTDHWIAGDAPILWAGYAAMR